MGNNSTINKLRQLKLKVWEAERDLFVVVMHFFLVYDYSLTFLPSYTGVPFSCNFYMDKYSDALINCNKLYSGGSNFCRLLRTPSLGGCIRKQHGSIDNCFMVSLIFSLFLAHATN